MLPIDRYPIMLNVTPNHIMGHFHAVVSVAQVFPGKFALNLAAKSRQGCEWAGLRECFEVITDSPVRANLVGRQQVADSECLVLTVEPENPHTASAVNIFLGAWQDFLQAGVGLFFCEKFSERSRHE